MAGNPSVILIEFNELSPSLMQRFMSQGRLPSFQRLYEESQIFVTDAEEEPPYLEPWIQWVTVHSGMPYRQHEVFHLSDGYKLPHDCVWDVLSKAGRRVWVCGSMNLRYSLPVNGWVLPDPWAVDAMPHPEELVPYHRFVRTSVMEHTRDHVPLSKGDYWKFLTFMTRHGLSPSTVAAIVRQLGSEGSGKSRWKRAAILDRLQFDLFHRTYRRLKPDFATFFSNSTAHFQHMYWRNMEPGLFKKKPTAEEQAEFGSAVSFGYQRMDDLIGGFLKLAGPETTLVLCSALSQQPCLKYEEQGGKTFYRPSDFEAFLSFAGIGAPHTVSPLMSEEFHLHFRDGGDAAAAARRLAALRLENRQVMHVHQDGGEISAGCIIHDHVPREALLHAEGGARARKFFELFYQADGLKSGMHHSDGILWIRYPNRQHAVHAQSVPLTSIAPTVLRNLSVPHPSHMQGVPLDQGASWVTG
jgi:hypothetical protein